MKRTIIKTVLITIISTFAVFLVSVTAITMLHPRKLSDYFYNIGNEKLSVWYIELQYQKTGNDDDLELLIYRAREAEDYKRLVQYSEKLINSDNYSEICKNNDDKESNKNFISFNDYIIGNYVIALYKTNAENDKIFEIADNNVRDAYLPNNAYQCLIYSGGITEDKEILTSIKQKLSLLKQKFSDNTELNQDYQYITNILYTTEGEQNG